MSNIENEENLQCEACEGYGRIECEPDSEEAHPCDTCHPIEYAAWLKAQPMTNNKQAVQELKPCPFCAGDAYLSEIDGGGMDTGDYLIFRGSCNDMDCHSKNYKPREEAITAWNTRADTAALVEALVALRNVKPGVDLQPLHDKADAAIKLAKGENQ